jgi:hypothetical protein
MADSRLAQFALCVLLAVSYPVLVISGAHLNEAIIGEDGVLEALTGLLFLISSLLFFHCAFRGHDGEHKRARASLERPIFYALLGTLFFLAFGEEISWGQRMFGWETPAKWAAMNVQGETNLHNLWVLFENHSDGTEKSELARLLTPERIFTLFFILYTIGVPVLCAVSKFASGLVQRIVLPIPNIFIGILFASGYIAHRIAYHFYGPIGAGHALEELREVIYAIVAMALALQFYLARRTAAVSGAVPA